MKLGVGVLVGTLLMKNNMKEFIVRNKWALLIATGIFSLYLYVTYNGNRICDCKSTEKYENGSTSRGGSSGVHRFYHK